MKPIRNQPILQAIILCILLPCIIWMPFTLQANPGGAQVVHGDVEIEAFGNTLSVLQESDKAIIEWQDFSIGSGETTEFLQPSSRAAALNRVMGSAGSLIDGTLRANGHVWLVNQNGIVVGPSGLIDVHSLVMTTLDVSNADFLDGDGRTTFSGPSINPVVNYGRVQTAQDGSAYFAAQTVENHGEIIGGMESKIILIGANEAVIDEAAGLVSVSNRVAGGAHPAVTNTGTIEGMDVTIAAHGNVFATAIQNTGIIRATSVDRSGGRVRLVNNGIGSVVNTGIVDASGETGGGQVEISSSGPVQLGGEIRVGSLAGPGGDIEVDGSMIEVMGGAVIDASGQTDGGFIRIGSDGSNGAVQTGNVTMGFDSTLSAVGHAGTGGAIDVNSAGLLLSQGAMIADGGIDGGSIELSGEDIMVASESTISTIGSENGGTITAQAQNTLVIDGAMDASGTNGQGGRVALTGEDIMVSQTGAVRANGGTQGGLVAASAQNELFIAGEVSAGASDGVGGTVDLSGDSVVVAMTGNVNASGSDGGGMVNIGAADQATILGTVRADGGTGTGGMVNLDATDVTVGPAANLSADGAIGGMVMMDATNSMDVAGRVSAAGSNGVGGTIGVTGDTINVAATSSIDASGATGGGGVYIGGGIGGNDERFRNASSVTIAPGSTISANATQAGNGGEIAFWSDGSMDFGGRAEARGAGAIGNGGFVEVSGLESFTTSGGSVSAAGSGAGLNGTFLIDPVNVTLGSSEFTMIEDALTTGDTNVIVHTAAVGGTPDPLEAGRVTIERGSQMIYNSDNSFSIFAHSDILFGSGGSGAVQIINNGSGNMTYVAGWDGTGAETFNNAPVPQTHVDNPAPPAGGHIGSISAADVLAGTFGEWGLNDGQITLNSDGQEVVEIGSAAGETNMFSDTIYGEVGNASNEHLQIGYNMTHHDGVSPVTGDINIHVKRNALFLGKELDYNEIKIGHGGDMRLASPNGLTDTINDFTISGDINMDVGGVLFARSSRRWGFFQIGHGGWGNPGNDDVNRNGDLRGDINITAGLIDFQTGQYYDNWIQVGHGGQAWKGNFAGDINVDVTRGDLRAAGGTTSTSTWANSDRGYVHFGHGGYQSGEVYSELFSHGGTTHTDAQNSFINQMRDDSGNLLFVSEDGTIHTDATAGDEIVRIGHMGDININVQNGSVHMSAGWDHYSQAHIGHGGFQTPGEHRGDVSVTAARDIIMDRHIIVEDADGTDHRGSGTYSFVHVGHGGAESVGGGHGNVSLEAVGNIELYAGRSSAYAMVGHGGRHETSGGGSSPTYLRRNTFAQGTSEGDLSVTSGGDFIMRSGFGRGGQAFAQVGHGGRHAYALPDEGHHGDIMLDIGGDLDFYAGQKADKLFGEQVEVESNRSDNFVMIGHGGRTVRGDHWGNITATVDGDFHMEGTSGYDAVGFIADTTWHDSAGGSSSQSMSTGAPAYNSWQNNSLTGDGNFAQFGHGGRDSEHMTAGTNSREHSGSDSTGFGNLGESNISLTVGGNIDMIAGNTSNQGVLSDLFLYSYDESVGESTRVGGGIDANSSTGARDLNNDGDTDDILLFTEPVYNSRDNWAMIGHGGGDGHVRSRDPEDGLKGHITVTAGGGISLIAGDGFRGSEPGTGSETDTTGPWVANGPDDSYLTLPSRWSDSTNSEDNYAMIGHGGNGTPSGALIGDISVTALGGDLLIHAGNGYRDWAKIGHGGQEAQANDGLDITDAEHIVQGHINVDALGDIDLNAGGRSYAFAQIGHLGLHFYTNVNNNVAVTNSDVSVLSRGGNITLDGGPFSARAENLDNANLSNGDIRFAMIGHGGYEMEMNVDADVSVEATLGNVELTGGVHQYDFARIGHGGVYINRRGVSQTFTLAGDVNVDAGGDVLVTGGTSPTDTPGVSPFDDVVDNDGDQVFLDHFYPADWNNDIYSYAQIGHGGGKQIGDGTGAVEYLGDINVNTNILGQNVILQGGDGPGNFALIGHGGASIQGALGATGDVNVHAANDILLTGGARFQNGGVDINLERNPNFSNFAQIGHSMLPNRTGVAERTGDTLGDVTVTALHDIVLTGGAGNTSHAGIGSLHTVGFDPTNPFTRDHFGDHSGNITVVVGNDLTLQGGTVNQADLNAGVNEGEMSNKPGAAGAFAQIGLGGLAANSGAGGFTGDIDVRVGNDILLQSGDGQDAYAKIGHGDFLFDNPTQGGQGFREGNISVSSGLNVTLVGAMIGHAERDFSPALALEGNTYVASSRNDPYGTGTIATSATTSYAGATAPSVLTSALGTELRLYMPARAQNMLAAETLLNGNEYVVPTVPPLRGGGTAGDELLATEFTYVYGLDGLPTGTFTPEGAFPTHAYGRYNLYYAGEGAGGGGGGGGGGDTPPILVEETGVDLDQLIFVEDLLEPDAGLEVEVEILEEGMSPFLLDLITAFQEQTTMKVVQDRNDDRVEEDDEEEPDTPADEGVFSIVLLAEGSIPGAGSASGDASAGLTEDQFRIYSMEELYELQKNGTSTTEVEINPAGNPGAIIGSGEAATVQGASASDPLDDEEGQNLLEQEESQGEVDALPQPNPEGETSLPGESQPLSEETGSDLDAAQAALDSLPDPQAQLDSETEPAMN